MGVRTGMGAAMLLLSGCAQMTMPELGRFEDRLNSSFPKASDMEPLTTHLQGHGFRPIAPVLTPDEGYCFTRQFDRPFKMDRLFRRVCALPDAAGRIAEIDVIEVGARS